MIKVLRRGPNWARIRASKRIVQRASWNQQDRYSRFCKLRLDGSENLMVGGCKAYHKEGNGIWLIAGYASDGSDVAKALAAMEVSWEQHERQQAGQATRLAA